jgi:hypothetical protein
LVRRPEDGEANVMKDLQAFPAIKARLESTLNRFFSAQEIFRMSLDASQSRDALHAHLSAWLQLSGSRMHLPANVPEQLNYTGPSSTHIKSHCLL